MRSLILQTRRIGRWKQSGKDQLLLQTINMASCLVIRIRIRTCRNNEIPIIGTAKKVKWFQPPDPKDQLCHKISVEPSRWTKKIGNQIIHWCGKCQNCKTKKKGRWTNRDYHHFTDEQSKKREQPGGTVPQANLVTPEPSLTSASSVVSQATMQQHNNGRMSLNEIVQQELNLQNN
jgi:hypothetical protein